MGDIARVKVGKYNLVARSGKCKVSVRVGKHKLGTRAGRCHLGVQARAGKNKLGARACKYKLGARDGKYKLGARAGTGDQEIKRPIPIPHYSSEDINKLSKIKRSNYIKSDYIIQYVMFSRIIECRTCSKSGLLFQRKLIIVCRWVSGK